MKNWLFLQVSIRSFISFGEELVFWGRCEIFFGLKNQFYGVFIRNFLGRNFIFWVGHVNPFPTTSWILCITFCWRCLCEKKLGQIGQDKPKNGPFIFFLQFVYYIFWIFSAKCNIITQKFFTLVFVHDSPVPKTKESWTKMGAKTVFYLFLWTFSLGFFRFYVSK